MSATGSCLCGNVTYTIEGSATDVGACHCNMCRRWTGSPGMAIHLTAAPVIEGETHMTWYGSSEWAERGFCGTCGSSLFYRLKGETPQYYLHAGSLDDQSALVLKEQIFIDEKPGYYDFAGDIPAMTGEEVIAMFASQEGGESDKG